MTRRNALVAILLLTLGLPISYGGSNQSDKLVWSVLAEICRRPAVRATGPDTSVGWRLWVTQGELYPGPPPSSPPSAASFNTFRPLACKPPVQQSLPALREPKQTVDGQAPCEVVWLNGPAAGYILTNRLYSRVNLINMATSQGGVHFPSGGANPAREIKTEWRLISPSQLGGYIVAADKAGNSYGLVAIHLMTHEAVQWTWSTWIHSDYVKYVDKSFMRDSFGVAANGGVSGPLKQLLESGNEAFLENYLLIGSQTGLFDPKYLSNPMMEGPGYKSYSCIGCHTFSAIDAHGNWPSPPPASLVGATAHLPHGRYPVDFDFSLTAMSKCGAGTTSVVALCNDIVLVGQ